MSTNGVDPLYELRPEERKRIDEIKENKDWVDEEAAQRAAQRKQRCLRQEGEGRKGHRMGHRLRVVADRS